MVKRRVPIKSRRSRKKRTYRYKGAKKRTFPKPASRSTKYLSNSVNVLPGLPNGKVVKMPYTWVGELTGGAGGTQGIQVFRTSSIYDPNFTGVGSQPLMHDELALRYKKYEVLGCKVTTSFQWTNGTTTGNAALCVAAPWDNINPFPTDRALCIERFPGKWRVLKNGTESKPVKITNYYSAKKFFQKKDVVDAAELISGFGFNPQLNAYVHTSVQDLQGGTATDDITCINTLSFIVRLTDPIPLTAS